MSCTTDGTRIHQLGQGAMWASTRVGQIHTLQMVGSHPATTTVEGDAGRSRIRLVLIYAGLMLYVLNLGICGGGLSRGRVLRLL